ncbi:CCR4-NOT transcription complex subunit 6-like [Eriocheir sinensis]|uniref:CCR4-NOT transcription complex subunit 6-like n=1 Tax=Eriocheir sinensis TaxID=95602 RepID=UPI0021C9A1C6|nr:CCR4-NOT transcription complex subunit 6-like [Eriocheir sinensis]
MSRTPKEGKESKSHRVRTHTIMGQEEVGAGKKSFWPELEITGNIRNISPAVWSLQHLTSLYLNDNCLSRIPAEIARLEHLMYLDLSCNKIRSLPAEIGELTRLRELLLNNNQLRVLPYEIGKLFNLQNIGLKGNPLTMEIQAVYSDSNGTLKLLSYMLDNLAVTTPQPPQRPWIHLGEPDRTKPSCIFTVMCYNVLCDKYATRQMYGYCPSWALEWEYRKKGIMDEIKHYIADIITLQEVETDQFFNFFLPELKNEGYDGIFSPKSRAKHMSENERKYVDGCAIFWRTSKFSLIKERLIEFNQLAMANHDGSEDMLNRVMTKDNIGLAALLETKEAAWENSEVPVDKSQMSQAVLVCTAHIHWDPEFCDVKLIQTIMLMSEIRQIVSQIVEESQHRSRPGRKIDPNSIQLLLCGDLNSLPDSGVVEFLTKGNVSMDHEDFKGFGYKTCLQKIAMTKNNNSLVNTAANIYTHSFRLSAAYDFSIMAYTNYTYDFKGIIDYIFHSADTMSALGVLGPIDPEWFRDNKVMGCPHPHIPSDHFSLLVQLEMRPATSALGHPNGLLHR